ncbi:MAG: hypothetical protein METHAR1v1_1560008 [Methanothrix sp.]|nr:MAG: hypothetical protein METHAR1v1_1560008 [Methanothrix sp.]
MDGSRKKAGSAGLPRCGWRGIPQTVIFRVIPRTCSISWAAQPSIGEIERFKINLIYLKLE